MEGELGPGSCSHVRGRHSCYTDNRFFSFFCLFQSKNISRLFKWRTKEVKSVLVHLRHEMFDLPFLVVDLCKQLWFIRTVVVWERTISFVWFVIRRGGMCFSIGTNKGAWKAIRRIQSMLPTGKETAARPKFTIHYKQPESFLHHQFESFKAPTQTDSDRREQTLPSVCYETNVVSMSLGWYDHSRCSIVGLP